MLSKAFDTFFRKTINFVENLEMKGIVGGRMCHVICVIMTHFVGKSIYDLPLNRQCTKIQLSQKNYWKILKSLINFESWKLLHCILRRHGLLGETTKQPLTNFEPLKPWKYKQLWGLRPGPLTLVFSCEFCEIFENTSFVEHIRVTASELFIRWHNYKVLHVSYVLSKLLQY